YLQARTKARIVTVALEKEQSALLAQKIDEVLDELRSTEGNPFRVPDSTPIELVDIDPLEQPLDTQFRTGAMGLGWDPTTAEIVIEAYAMVDEIDLDEFGSEPIEVEPAEALLVRIPVGTARAFAKRTHEVVGAGRPSCPLCGYPMNPEGHVCAQPGALG
ncbi:MAG TPA: DUF3090 family protein, partial [Propionicimonas sp.]|uniref:DUF3090 family protein n=1 Tax=Propionicimonas sp. TaxID=1955623 RepID=UPI002F3E85C1